MKCQSQSLAMTHVYVSGKFPENIVSYHQSCIKSIKTHIVVRNCVLVLGSLALLLAVIISVHHLRWRCHEGMSACWLFVSGCRGWFVSVYLCIPLHARLPLRSDYVAHHTLFDLLVNCLGGPLIDTWDGDWILSPVSDVWQLTPSLLITSFTQATGLLCLGQHNTAFSYWGFFSEVLTVFFSYTHLWWSWQITSPAALNFFQLLTPYFKCSKCSLILFIIYLDWFVIRWWWMTDDWQRYLLTGSVRQLHVTPTVHEVMLVTNFLTAVWLTPLSPSASGTQKSICLPARRVQILSIKTCSCILLFVTLDFSQFDWF